MVTFNAGLCLLICHSMENSSHYLAGFIFFEKFEAGQLILKLWVSFYLNETGYLKWVSVASSKKLEE